MATTPQQAPPKSAAPPAASPPAARVEAAKKPEPDPPVKTAADEQRERSDEVLAKGVETVKAERDERDPKDRPHAADQAAGQPSKR